MMNYEEILMTIGIWELTKHALKKIWRVFNDVTKQR